MVKPGEICIKDVGVLTGLMLKKFDLQLLSIVTWLFATHGGVMTESYRPPTHSGDLHGTVPVRAIDMRTWCYADGKAAQIADEINKKWCYDINRPDMKVALIHDSGQGIHFHIQVHPNTKLR